MAANFSMASWAESVVARHNDQVMAGLHDEDCEWLAAGFWLCHCGMRKRVASGLTTPPHMIYNPPSCSNCENELVHDGDSFVCTECHTTFPQNCDEPGTFYDDHGDLTEARAKYLKVHQ